ncbi:MAG: stage III sporulation protein AF [Christensenellales bacterium]
MSSFSVWVLSIAGICVLSVLVELILPDGQTRKYIKAIFSFFVIIVIVSPLPKLVKNGVDLDSIIAGDNIGIQEDFIYQLNRNKLDSISLNIENELKEQGIDGVKILLSANIFSSKLEIEAVFVDLFELVIPDDKQHINTHEIIIKTIKKHIDIEEENIVFNE